MTIGKVAKAAGVRASAIRYYESTGIIPKPLRKNGVRQYGPDAIDELKALRFYRASGVPIRGLTAIGAQPRGTRARGAVWAEVIRARINDLDTWMQEAGKTKELLEQVIACRCSGKRERCEVMRVVDAM
jgi:MerR family transcriptional regulator, redox-sensitive transcriptional activator SoxR